MWLFSYLLFGGYCGLILWLSKGFSRLEKKNYPAVLVPENSFSIVVAFRNEIENLPILLESFIALNYPKHLFEIILIDDFSEDDSWQFVADFQLKNTSIDITLLKNELPSKKQAIAFAIKNSKNPWIVCTDADCKTPISWLQNFDAFIQKNPTKFLAAPVYLKDESGFLNAFQQLDFFSLMGATLGGFGIKKPFMCNGANLCYSKTAFEEVEGFKGNLKIASGDDIFLLEKILQKHPNEVHFLASTEAAIETQAVKSWKALFEQRIRWAAKTTNYTLLFAKWVGSIVFLTNFWVLYFWFFIEKTSLSTGLVILSAKLLVDFVLIRKTAFFLNQPNNLKYYIAISIIYPFFTFLVAVLSLFKGYSWKGRTYKK